MREGLLCAVLIAACNSPPPYIHTYIHTYIHSGLTGLRHARAPHFPDSRLDEPVIGKAKGGCRPQIQSGQSVALNPRAPDGPRPTAHTPVLQ